MKEELLSIRPRGEGYPHDTLIPSGSFITGEELANRLGFTDGISFNSDTDWYSVILDDKKLVVPLLPIRYQINWRQLYENGLVYGTNNNGKYPSGTPTNQMRTIWVNDSLYKVRLLTGANVDPTPQMRGVSIAGTSNSEFNRIYMPISSENTPLYSGPKLRSFSPAELGFDSGNGSWTCCIETENGSALSTVRGKESVNRVDGSTKALVPAVISMG